MAALRIPIALVVTATPKRANAQGFPCQRFVIAVMWRQTTAPAALLAWQTAVEITPNASNTTTWNTVTSVVLRPSAKDPPNVSIMGLVKNATRVMDRPVVQAKVVSMARWRMGLLGRQKAM